MKIVTWNTQGSPLNNTTKRSQLDSFLAANEYVLIQEAGSLADQTTYTATNNTQYDVVGLAQAGAGNNRCGTAMVTRRNYDSVGYQSLVNSSGRFGIWLRDTATNTYVCTLHSNASSNAGADATGLLKHLYTLLGDQAKITVGGDYNMTPPASPYNVGTTSRPQNWVVSSIGQPTHFGSTTNRELDFFMSRNITIQGIVGGPQTNGKGTAGSDHRAVILTI